MHQAGYRQAIEDSIRVHAQPPDKFSHQRRLYRLARRLAEDRPYDDDVLHAAAWMHDLGVFLGHRPQDPAELARWDHVPYTIARTRELLAKWGFPADKLEAVAEVIQTHRPDDVPVLIEAILLRDADILEQLGAIGALRALAKVGRDSRYTTFSSVLPVLRRAAEYLPARLRLNNARSLAAPRVELLRLFIAGIEEEAGELLC